MKGGENIDQYKLLLKKINQEGIELYFFQETAEGMMISFVVTDEDLFLDLIEEAIKEGNVSLTFFYESENLLEPINFEL